MAEVLAEIGIVASVAQLADYGFKLSVKLYTFSSTVSSASSFIKALSSDVSLTSTVLQELCLIIKSDEGSHVISDTAIQATSQTVKDCLAVFEQLDEALDKSMKGMKERGSKRVLEKLKWPFKLPKMDLLRGNLDRLKVSLTLMLQVLSYARDASHRKAAQSSLVRQKHLIESLARSERDMNRTYINMQRALEFQATNSDFYATTNASVHISTSREIPADSDFMVKTTSAKRSLSKDAEPKSLCAETIDTPPVKPRTVIGELLLCFRLLNDILGYHMAVSKLSDITALGYDDLRGALQKVQDEEFKKMETQHAAAPIYVKAEAVKNLQTRLRELPKAGYLMKRDTALKEDSETNAGKFLESQPVAIVPAQDHQVKYDYLSWEGLDEFASYDPYIPNPSTAQPDKSRTAALQAEIDRTVGIMRESIDKVSQRGDRLDSLQDKTDRLAISQQGFRRGADRVRKSQWSVPLQAIASLGMVGIEAVQGVGSGVVQASRGIGGALYNVGEKIFADAGGEVDKEEFVGSPVRIIGGRFEDVSDDDSDGDDEDNDGEDQKLEVGDVVDDLLAQCTTLSEEREVEGPPVAFASE